MNRKTQLGKLKLAKHEVVEEEKEYDDRGFESPVNPMDECLNSSVLNLCIYALFESEVPLSDDSQAITWIRDVFLHLHPRFSSIMVADNKGIKQWRKVKVKPENHIKTPIFPSETSREVYDDCLENYMSKITMKLLPQDKPLWEIHLIKYRTTNALGTIILKLHHSLGDGYSLIGALISSFRNAKNPSLPLTFPNARSKNMNEGDRRSNILKIMPTVFSSAFNTISDFGLSIMKSCLIEDRISPIRSGVADVKPKSFATMAFSLRDIKQIKDHLGVSVNDVISGTIFAGTRLYQEATKEGSSNISATAAMLFNTRMLKANVSIEEMLKPNTKSPWGNHAAFVQIPIPTFTNDDHSNPLEIIKKTNEIVQNKKISFGFYLVYWFLVAISKIFGIEALAKVVRNTMLYPSMVISNVIGPLEKVSLFNHPIKLLSFTVGGLPNSTFVTIISYMEMLNVTLTVEKGFIEVEKFKFYIEKAFEMMLKATHEK